MLLSAEGMPAAGCASSRDTQPHAMSAAAHESVAGQHERAAATHEAARSPQAVEERAGCAAPVLGAQVCWSAARTDPDEHAAQAEEHRRIAAEHRAASAALRAAEASACATIASDDRDISPFEHVEDVAAVEPLYEMVTVSKETSPRLVGASVLFRPVPGLTIERLQQIIDCHLARNAALGHNTSRMPDCPLVPAGVSAAVEQTPTGLVVLLRAADPATAREVLERAERLSKASLRTSVRAVKGPLL
ncbi:hypothetical protein [Nannocystis pusilla]|uniref:hypothetical protein n=1 Tax=Nannocystis pusilla TaxID=889268 RepID=UPI003BF326DA